MNSKTGNGSHKQNGLKTLSALKQELASHREELTQIKQSYEQKIQMLRTRRSVVASKQSLAASFAFTNKAVAVAQKAEKELANLDMQISKLQQQYNAKQRQIMAKIETLEEYILKNREQLKQNNKIKRQQQKIINADERRKNIIAIAAAAIIFIICSVVVGFEIVREEKQKAELQAKINTEERRDYYLNIAPEFEIACNLNDDLTCAAFSLDGKFSQYDTVTLSSSIGDIETSGNEFIVSIQALPWDVNYESEEFQIDSINDSQEQLVNFSLSNTILEREVAKNECIIHLYLTDEDKNKIAEKHEAWQAKITKEAKEKAEQERLEAERKQRTEQEKQSQTQQQPAATKAYGAGTFNSTLAITITGIDRNLAEEGGLELISLNLTVKNISKSSCSFWGYGDYATLSYTGKQLTAGKNTQGEFGSMFHPSIKAGESISGNIYYWVPSGASLHTFNYEPSYENNGISINF